MKKILVTGAGFIGTHVVDELLKKDYQVSIFDRFPYEKISNKRWDSNVKAFFGDIRDRESVMEAVYAHDAVINLAAILGTMETINNPHESVDTNIHGALNVFEACKPCSMHPDGIPAIQITVGNHWMNNSYSITKSCSERFAFMFNKEHKTNIKVIRALNAYGEGQRHKPVRKITPNFIVKALRCEPIEIFGDGTQIMDMVYVKDVARVIVAALENNDAPNDTVYEVGSGVPTTVNDIANLINEITCSNAGIKYLPMRQGEPEKSTVLGDPTTLLPFGFDGSDFISLHAGFEKTINWYKIHYDWSE